MSQLCQFETEATRPVLFVGRSDLVYVQASSSGFDDSSITGRASLSRIARAETTFACASLTELKPNSSSH